MNRDHDAMPVVLAIVAVLAVGGAIAATTSYPATSGVTFQTDSGLSVTTGKDISVRSGNPFPDSNTLELQNVTFSASGQSSLTVDTYNGMWTNISNVNAGARTTINAPNKQLIRVEGSPSVLKFKDVNVSQSGPRDLRYSASSQFTLVVDTNGTGAVAVDADTGEALDEGTVQADGTVVFKLPSGTEDVDIQTNPSALFVYNELQPSQLVQNNTTLRFRFFVQGTATVVERTVDNGSVQIPDSLPTDKQIIVTVKSKNSSFQYRRILLDSLTEQQEIYLLNKSQPSVQDIFKIRDATDDFSGEGTQILIQKPITKDFDGNGVNETRFQTITGDVIGAGDFPAVLATESRYRIIVRNEQGDRRVLGAFVPSVSRTVTLRVTGLSYDASRQSTAYRYDTTYQNASRTVLVNFSALNSSVSSVEITLYNRSASPSNAFFSKTYADPGEILLNESLPPGTGEIGVQIIVELADGTTTTAQFIIGPSIGAQLPIDGIWLSTFAAGVVLISVGALAPNKAELAAVVGAVEGGVFFALGWLPGEVTGMMIAVALLVAVVFKIRSGTGVPA